MSKRNTLTLLICARQTCRHHDAAARSRCRLFPGLSVNECRHAVIRRIDNPTKKDPAK